MSQEAIDFIQHYGTKGMHWGVRNKQPRRESSDYKRTKNLRNRKPHELTNKQLSELNNRRNLEQNFQRLNPSKAKRGKEAVAAMLATATLATTAYNLVNSPLGKKLSQLGKKNVNQQLKLF
jgi:hypothetical protein